MSHHEPMLAPYPAAQPPYQPPAPPSKGWSTAAFVMAAISVLFFPVIFGPLGIIFAIVALAKGQPNAGAAMAAAVIAPLMGMIVGAVIGAAFLA